MELFKLFIQNKGDYFENIDIYIDIDIEISILINIVLVNNYIYID